tara:strand:+ start:15473 stop:16525 length:1053 start_codon:yes stop_codon:yes gene_type:complete
MEFNIGKVKLSNDKIVVIAEAGVNYNNSLDIGEKLIQSAKSSGCDIIKFQTYKAEKLVVKNSERFWDWDGEELSSGSQFDSYKLLDSFGKKEYIRLKEICDHNEIEFLSTPFDEESSNMLVDIGINGFKIASCDITNKNFLKHLSKHKKPLLLSTGASTIQDIDYALKIIEENGDPPVCIMHCTLSYPTKTEDANLSALLDIHKNFSKHLLGLSDHTLDYLVGPSSTLYGSRVFEKHFTIDKNLKLSADHWLSLNPYEMEQYVINCNEFFRSIGSGKKELLNAEKIAHKNARRSLVTNKKLSKGHIITDKDLAAKRPGIGISPKEIENIIGKKIAKNLDEDTILLQEHFD